MFEFKNKTIDQLREEVASHIGKPVVTSTGHTAIIKTVTDCFDYEDGVVIHNGKKFCLTKDGKPGKRMYSFNVVVVSKISTRGVDYICTQCEYIAVPYSDKDKKMTKNPFCLIKRI